MTWKDFKQFVEKHGVQDSDNIAWIECWMGKSRELVVVKEPNGSYAVANKVETGKRNRTNRG